jgi:hypothetical protein
MIQPSNGRVVLFQPGASFNGVQYDRTQKLAATVVHVWNDRMVNLAVFDSIGHCYAMTDVQLLQDLDEPRGDTWCEWMPYQKGQAAKTEALEAAGGGRAGS